MIFNGDTLFVSHLTKRACICHGTEYVCLSLCVCVSVSVWVCGCECVWMVCGCVGGWVWVCCWEGRGEVGGWVGGGRMGERRWWWLCRRKKRHAVSVQGRAHEAARHLRSLTPGRLRSHGPVPVYKASKNPSRTLAVNRARVGASGSGVHLHVEKPVKICHKPPQTYA